MAWAGSRPENNAAGETRRQAGYAVTALSAKTTPTGLGLALTFTRVVDGKLDPKDSYESGWVGASKDGDGPGPATVGRKEELPLSFIGKATPAGITGVGLQYADAGKKGPDVGGPPAVAGAPTDPPFFDPVPPGGTLIGVEIGLGKIGSGLAAKGIRRFSASATSRCSARGTARSVRAR